MAPGPEGESPAWSPHQSPHERPWLVQRAVAALEVLLCSDYPTQLALGATFGALGFRLTGPNGHLLVGSVVTLELVDTALLIGLIFFFLHAHGERGRDVLLGRRSIQREAVVGISLTFVAMVIGIGALVTIQRFAPSLHTVEHNPFQ